MSIKQNALDALVAYFDSHVEWKKVQDGQRAKAKREAHKALLDAAELYKPQHKPRDSER